MHTGGLEKLGVAAVVCQMQLGAAQGIARQIECLVRGIARESVTAIGLDVFRSHLVSKRNKS